MLDGLGDADRQRTRARLLDARNGFVEALLPETNLHLGLGFGLLKFDG
jgi:hypothetical protein